MTGHHIHVILTALVICAPLPAQVIFLRTYGEETGDDWAYCVRQADDGGYIVVGLTQVRGGVPPDAWIIKTDSLGDTLWTRTYGGTEDDEALSVELTDDGGYIVAGFTMSFGAGSADAWIIKTDARGDTVWTRTYGGADADKARSVLQTDDHGYIVVGYNGSIGAGMYDVWIIKTDSLGDTLWTRTYGGPDWDLGRSVLQTADGGFIIAGLTMSFGAGGADAWLVKTDSLGDTLWTRTYGGPGDDEALSVELTADGGYIVAGCAMSFGAGMYDVWLIRTDSLGDTLWTRTFGGAYNDGARSIQRTSDDGFILACNTDLYGAGTDDDWLIKTDANGDTLWTGTYGSTNWDYANSAQQTRDGGYVMAGWTIPFTTPFADILLVKTDPLGSVGIAEAPSTRARALSTGPTICCGVLRIDGSRQPGDRLELLDISSRKVLDLKPGPNDVRALTPGVYFVREQGTRGQGTGGASVTKVVLTK